MPKSLRILGAKKGAACSASGSPFLPIRPAPSPMIFAAQIPLRKETPHATSMGAVMLG
eukprot:CAMPEP_0179486518 /NCGR_PEP_ID=MMETSP0799-20121207/62789_1 /TAXON_ID=46947 /ORGANISM="Geminigera cryophila, Strain CCMP2564" /LENGTH=57 /DNA_ID=CAMNT_0021301291 /DNA_START=121 /DNA_END=290 /DNA_ORIENTATION=-